MVRLYTDLPWFWNDIAEEVRLFVNDTVLQAEQGQQDGADTEVSVTLSQDKNEWTAVAHCSAQGRRAHYEYTCPAIVGSELVIKRHMKRAVKIAAFRAMRELFAVYTPWGSLTGIRPTRLLRELMEDMGEAGALGMMQNGFDVLPQKLELAHEIVNVQRPLLESQTDNDIDVYVGIPFCKTRCLYCSFLSEVRDKKTDMAAYILALKRDIALGARIATESGYKVRSMYMGGGTPTVLTAGELEDVLSFSIDAYGGFGSELTVEAGRPDTITPDKLHVIKRLGAQRISINPQTMNEHTLALVGRSHTPEEIEKAYHMAREIGFASINMDVIAGLPGETLDDMHETLERIAALAPENLTVHTLAIKRSSRLAQCLESYPLPSAETVDGMVALGLETARGMGMRPYYMYRQKYMRGNLENVGYAKIGTECIYNVDMMEETTSIMAHGAGAMSKRIFGGEHRVERIPNPKDIATYIDKVDAVAQEKRELFGV